MLPDGWKDWKACTEEDLYKCLGLDPERADYYDEETIKNHYNERYEWFQKKMSIKNSPMWDGKFDLAVKNLQKAYSVLTNKQEKKEYDVHLKEERQKANKQQLRQLVINPTLEKDKILTPEEEENILYAGKKLGISERECKELIEEALKDFGGKRHISTTMTNGLEFFREAIYLAIVDGWLEPKEKRHLITVISKKYGISEDEAKTEIIKCLKEKGAREGSPKKSDLPEEMQGKNYYEIFGISEKATSIEIDSAYNNLFNIWNSRASNPKYTPYVRAVKDFLLEAKNTLLDPVRRTQYDENLKEIPDEEELWEKPPGIPKLEIWDDSGTEKRIFELKSMRMGAPISFNVIAKNGGGGILNADVKTSHPWLIVDTNKIQHSKLPQNITVTVDPSKDKSCYHFGAVGNGYVEIIYQKGPNKETERINVSFGIEVPEAALKRFRNMFMPATAVIGASIGILTGSFLTEMWTLIASGLLIALSIYIGIKEREWTFGCLTFVIGGIILAILGNYFPKVFSVVSGILAFTTIGYALSKPLFTYQCAGKKPIPAITWAFAGIMVFLTLILGTSQKVFKESLPRFTVSVIKDGSINLRAEASKTAGVLGVTNLRKGDKLDVLETKDDWHKVKIKIGGKDKIGWIHRSLVTPIDRVPPKTAVVSKEIKTAKEETSKPKLDQEMQIKPFRMKTWAYGPGGGKGVDIQLVSVDVRQDKVIIGFSVKSDDHKDILLYGQALRPDSTGVFYGERLYIVDDKGKKVYSTTGFVGGKQSKFNSSANQINVEPGEEVHIFAEFPMVTEDAKSFKFVSPILHGHQNEWRWDKIPLKSFDIRTSKIPPIIPTPTLEDHLSRARVHIGTTEYQKVMEELEQAKKLKPESSQPYIVATEAYLAQGRKEDAMKEFLEAVKRGIEGKHPIVLNIRTGYGPLKIEAKEVKSIEGGIVKLKDGGRYEGEMSLETK